MNDTNEQNMWDLYMDQLIYDEPQTLTFPDADDNCTIDSTYEELIAG